MKAEEIYKQYKHDENRRIYTHNIIKCKLSIQLIQLVTETGRTIHMPVRQCDYLIRMHMLV